MRHTGIDLPAFASKMPSFLTAFQSKTVCETELEWRRRHLTQNHPTMLGWETWKKLEKRDPGKQNTTTLRLSIISSEAGVEWWHLNITWCTKELAWAPTTIHIGIDLWYKVASSMERASIPQLYIASGRLRLAMAWSVWSPNNRRTHTARLSYGGHQYRTNRPNGVDLLIAGTRCLRYSFLTHWMTRVPKVDLRL